MTEQEKMRLELLELKMHDIMWRRSMGYEYGFIDHDEKARNDRILELEQLLETLKGE